MEACISRYIAAETVHPSDLARALSTVQFREAWGVILTETGFDLEPVDPGFLSFIQELAETLAQHCEAQGLPLAIFSSPLVFDGSSMEPYTESRPVSPLTAAGTALAGIEQTTSRIHPRTLIIRHGHLVGFDSDETTLARFGEADIISFAHLPDLANATIDLLIDDEQGIWHLANTGCVRWSDSRRSVEEALGFPAIHGFQRSENQKMRAIASERGWPMRDWESALVYLADHNRNRNRSPAHVAVGDD
jgi:dTDP-4-dehydrorhamnose reductase